VKILLTHRYCLIGGIEAWMVALQRSFVAAGHQCELFFFDDGPMRTWLPPDCPAHFGGLADCVRLVRSGRFDIVHAPTMDWQVGISAVRGAGAKLIVTAHNLLEHAFTSTACDAFTAVSQWLAEASQEQTDLPVQVIYNGIDLTRFRPDGPLGASFGAPPPAGPIIAWVGRGLELKQKRLDLFAAAARHWEQAGWRIWLAEPYGPVQLAAVRPEITEALRPVAEFWGPVSAERMPEFYRQVAASGGVFVSTSAYEGFGLVLAEAQACGCPVIAPNVSGVNEVVNPAEGGWLYPSEIKPEELAALVTERLRAQAGLREYRQAALAQVRARFSLGRMSQAYLQLYEAAPLPVRAQDKAARRRLAPWRDWQAHLAQCWSPGQYQYETSRRLAAQQEWLLAAAVARVSLATCPTLFARPQRLAHLLKAQVLASTRERVAS
jgi:glycosyltransferase involved in cell wall biosynthesis